MKKIPMLLTVAVLLATGCQRLHTTAAGESPVRFVGRTLSTPEGVSFDWSGTYADIRFKGSYLAMTVSDSGRDYFNLTVDGCSCEKFPVQGDSLTIVLFDDRTADGEHHVRIQKATESEQGRVTVHSFTTDGRLLPADGCARPRYIEFYGDSITCGYGTESTSGSDPFLPETENCLYSYASCTAARFDADYNLVAHSGRGVVRNYGDPQPCSDPSETMSVRAFRLFDMQSEPLWDFSKSPYRPDAIVITLGTNDFSTEPHPDSETFAAAYRRLIEAIRMAYGEPLPVLCVVHSPLALEHIRQAVAEVPRTAIADVSWGVYNRTSDLGASEHPNRYGHEKIAAIVTERLAALTGWEPVE